MAKDFTTRPGETGEESCSRKLPVSAPPGGRIVTVKVTALSCGRLLSCSSELSLLFDIYVRILPNGGVPQVRPW